MTETETAPRALADETTIDVFLVDDHKCVVWGLERLIAGERPRMRVAGKAHNRIDALAGVRAAKPHVILLDLDLGGDNGLDLMPELTARSDAAVIVLTGSRDGNALARAVSLGARGIVAKNEPADILLRAIDRVHHGELWLERATMTRMLDTLKHGRRDADEQLDSLTPKERRIVAAVVEHRGANSRDIAARLFISDHTLRNHLTTIYRKLDVRNRVELVMHAIERGFGKAEAGGPTMPAFGQPPSH